MNTNPVTATEFFKRGRGCSVASLLSGSHVYFVPTTRWDVGMYLLVTQTGDIVGEFDSRDEAIEADKKEEQTCRP